jgi:hypothetical protein
MLSLAICLIQKEVKFVTGVTGNIYVPDNVHATFILHIYDLKCSSYAKFESVKTTKTWRIKLKTRKLGGPVELCRRRKYKVLKLNVN